MLSTVSGENEKDNEKSVNNAATTFASATAANDHHNNYYIDES